MQVNSILHKQISILKRFYEKLYNISSLKNSSYNALVMIQKLLYAFDISVNSVPIMCNVYEGNKHHYSNDTIIL